jgi:YqaJ-like viral recombinase domain
MRTVLWDIEQNTAAWSQAKCGVLSCSSLSDVLAKGQGKTRRTLLLRLLGEQLTGKPEESYSNGFMERGHELEGSACDRFEFIHEVPLLKAGFITNSSLIPGRVLGYSPDRLIGTRESFRSGLEVKTRMARLQIELLLADKVPSEHWAQLQGAMWVGELDHMEFFCHCPGLPDFHRRVERDPTYIATLKIATEDFFTEMDSIKDQIQRMAA